MKTLTVQEASQDLSRLVRRAVEGEEIAIHDGPCTVLLRPVPPTPENGRKGLEALRQLQAQSRLTLAQADGYLREVHAERLAPENGHGR